MSELFETSLYFGALVSILAYEAGLLLKKRFRLAIFNPLLIAIAVTILVLVVLDIDYDTYYEGAKYLSYLLTPATVALAVPLYEQFALLKRHKAAVLLGIGAGVLASAGTILLFSLLLGLEHTPYVTMLPKSITTAIGMGIAEELGGHVPVTVALIVITGVQGHIMAEAVCRLFGITEPVARGIAVGTASHAIGTSKAMEMGEIEGAMSSLSIVVAGILTVIVLPLFARLP